MNDAGFPFAGPVPILSQVQYGLHAVLPWIEQLRPRCTHFLPPLCIGVLDTGIDLGHSAFAGASIVARSFVGSTDVRDELGQGTHNAGLLVAQPECGAPGLCPDTILFSAKVIVPNQSFEQMEDATYKALLWLAKVECPLILLPQGTLRNSMLVRRALMALMEQRAIVLAGTGERGGDIPLFPASMRGVLAVSALATNGKPLQASFQGDGVDLYAPGEGLISTGLRGWERRSGSALATVVAGGLLARALSGKALHP